MKIKTKEFQKALEQVLPGTVGKSIAFVQGGDHVTFTENYIISYNDVISVRVPFKTGITGTVKAKEFNALLKKLPEEISIEMKDSQIIIKAERTTAGFTILEHSLVDFEELEEEQQWGDLPEDFVYYFSIAAKNCKKNNFNPILEGVGIFQEGIIVGGSQHRIFHVGLNEAFSLEEDIVLPSSVSNALSIIDPIEILHMGSWTHFRNDQGVIVSCRTLQGSYPITVISNILNLEGVEVELPSFILEMIDRGDVFSKKFNGSSEFITIKIEKKVLYIEGENEFGFIQERSSIDFDEDLEFLINPSLLKDILKETTILTVNQKALIFKGDQWTYVLAKVATAKSEK